jgi:hypothetical protein
VETALREHGVEVVISVTGGANILDQISLIDAIRAAGTVKVRTADAGPFPGTRAPDTKIRCHAEISAVGVRARRGPRAAGGCGAGILRG